MLISESESPIGNTLAALWLAFYSSKMYFSFPLLNMYEVFFVFYNVKKSSVVFVSVGGEAVSII
jgi:hypothetical protein